MRLVIFGLTVSSAWGNGLAALWRSLIGALAKRGHHVVFFERDAPYYRAHRDMPALSDGARLRIYTAWNDIRREAQSELDTADAAIVTSFCPDGRAACELVLGSRKLRVFYDMDTPVTLSRLATGEDVPYLPHDGLGGFDLVLSFTGGRALDLLVDRLHARRVAPLYGSVDPTRHRPVQPVATWAAACSYLGTWSEDRQAMLETLFVEAARRHPDRLFVIGGSMYPSSIGWPTNVVKFDHVPPPQHPQFYCSSPVTLIVTRAPMAELGYCPSGRLFEAAACGVPVVSDAWQGIDEFFTPGEEILIAHTTEDMSAALALNRDKLVGIGHRARERVLAEHSGMRRADQLIALLQ